MVGVFLLVAIIWSVVLTVATLARVRDGRAPADDVGFWWLIILALYATLPPLAWWAQGEQYTPLSPRLYSLAPTTGDVLYLLEIATAFALSFACVYWPIRSRALTSSQTRISTVPTSYMAAAGVIVAITLAADSAVWLFSERGVDYIDTYRVINDMPLLLRQFLKVVQSLGAVATFVLLIGILQRWPRQRWLLILYIGAVLLSFDPSGSRSGIAIQFFALAIGWHVIVRPIHTRSWALGGLVGLAAFLGIGLLRTVQSATQLGPTEFTSLGLGEFDSVWANSLELAKAAQGGLSVPFTTRFAEFWAFVPSQLLPFAKNDLATWFVDSFWPAYKERGGGLAFGALAQAVIGGGILEAVLRGAALGLVAGLVFRWYRSGNRRWWAFPAYVYLLVDVVQSVRDTVFRPLGDMVELVFPSLICIALLGSIMGITGRRHERPPVSQSANPLRG